MNGLGLGVHILRLVVVVGLGGVVGMGLDEAIGMGVFFAL